MCPTTVKTGVPLAFIRPRAGQSSPNGGQCAALGAAENPLFAQDRVPESDGRDVADIEQDGSAQCVHRVDAGHVASRDLGLWPTPSARWQRGRGRRLCGATPSSGCIAVEGKQVSSNARKVDGGHIDGEQHCRRCRACNIALGLVGEHQYDPGIERRDVQVRMSATRC